MFAFSFTFGLTPELSALVNRALTIFETALVDVSALQAELNKLRPATTALENTVDANK